VELWVLGLAPARALTGLLLFQSAEAKAFWQLAEGAVVQSLMVAVAVEPCAVPLCRPVAVGAMDSVTPAAWESEHYRVSAPAVPLLAEVPTRAAVRED
jgi:hypothetical protein